MSEAASSGSAAVRSESPKRETTAAVHSRPKPPRQVGAVLPSTASVAATAPPRSGGLPVAPTVGHATDNAGHTAGVRP
ncbi:hypothetical protein GCM10010275_26250 [Streptomyces litmocidini]|nr:hypothetical protein GCM10010275_26250 [Streptomyces litmocidini]